MNKYFAVAMGGALGALARYLLSVIITAQLDSKFPYATFLINITGSFIIGLFLTIALADPPISENWRLAVAVGFVGAYTTFSTFEYETLKLLQEGRVALGFGYVFLS